MFLCGVAIDTKLGYAFDKPAMWTLSDCGFFSLLFQMKQKVQNRVLSVHVGVTNLLFFHSGAPPLCAPPHLGPAAG